MLRFEMKPSIQSLILCVSLIIVAVVSTPNGVVLTSARELSPLRPAGRSLLSHPPKQGFELVAAPNGTVYLFESESRKVVWSFSSGPPIYSSYQSPTSLDAEKNNVVGPIRYSFSDCGDSEDDWKLCLNDHYKKLKFEVTIEDYVKKTPIYENDVVTVGSMHSTAFKVEFMTGKLINAYGKSAVANVSRGHEETVSPEGTKELEISVPLNQKGSDVELYIKRRDYSLSATASDKVLWNLTIGFFKAKLQCRGPEHLLEGASLDLDHKSRSSSDSRRIMSLPCGVKFAVRCFHNQSEFEYFLRADEGEHNLLPAGAQKDMRISPDKAILNLGLPITHSNVRQTLEVLDRTHKRRLGVLSVLRIPSLWLFVLVAFVIFYAFRYKSTERTNTEFIMRANLNGQHVSSKRRKSRKSGKSIADLEEGVNAIKRMLNLNSLVSNDTDGRTVGKLFVSSRELAKGSNGTVVYEGIHEGRIVAVKRLVKAHHGVAFKEIQNLIASDQHPNFLRYHGMEYDRDFVYLSLELCACNLHDLIESYADSPWNTVVDDNASQAMMEHKIRLESVRATMQDINLWDSNGYPSALLLKLMRNVVSGLVHLHGLGIIHRDIKPQNVLICKIHENNVETLCAKLSDMGISKQLLKDVSSLGHHATGHGSPGWQAPEQLLHGRQTRAMDMFSLGCVLFFCATGGSHPFGSRFERENNIKNNQVDLFLVEHMPEAQDLFSLLLQPDPQLRPTAVEVLQHPFWWNSDKCLSFLCDTSDVAELAEKKGHSDFLNALESIASAVNCNKWDEKMDPAFITSIRGHRGYNYGSVRHLLRVLRNKGHHYGELPSEIQELLGSIPNEFYEYFRSRFPRLMIEVYKVVCIYYRSEKWFEKYVPR